MTGEPTKSLAVRPTGEVRPIRDDAMVLAARIAAAQLEAELRLRIDVADKKGRDLDAVRALILHDAEDPDWAENALYHKPIGKKDGQQQFAVNWSIRAIESMIQIWNHVHTVVRYVYEDALVLRINVTVLDLLTNSSYSLDANVEKNVERKDPKEREVLARRRNSYGDLVYLVEATADEFRNKLGAERSKMIRDFGQRLLKRSILDEARAKVDATLTNENARDPDAKRKEIFDKFGALGVNPAMLKEYLESPLEAISPKELTELRGLYNGISQGNITWAEVMAAKRESAEDEGAPPAAEPPKSKVREATDRIINKSKQGAVKPEEQKPPEKPKEDDKW